MSVVRDDCNRNKKCECPEAAEDRTTYCDPAEAPLPTHVKIGPYVYRVLTEEGLIRERKARGEMRPAQQVIALDASLTATQRAEALWHEILEVIDNEYVLDLKHDEQLSVLAVVLCGVQVDNPGLLA